MLAASSSPSLKTLSVYCFLLLVAFHSSSAFIIRPSVSLRTNMNGNINEQQHQQLPGTTSTTSSSSATTATTTTTTTQISMIEQDYYEELDETNQVKVEPGSHDELMYALGVNLARQLGDVRPLVESGDELAHVAKGLLDTVVGRLNDDGQRLLLSSRGKELDALILNRA